MGDSIHMLVRCSPGPKLLGARLTIKAWGPVVSSIHVVLTVILIPEGSCTGHTIIHVGMIVKTRETRKNRELLG